MKIAVGITTAPRKKRTLDQSYRSVANAGFDRIHVFAEPGSDVTKVPNPVVRPHTVSPNRFKAKAKFGAWRNYVQSLADLLHAERDASAVLMVQDDVTLVRGTRAFLERDLWPSANTGGVMLVPSVVYKRITDRPGCCPIQTQRDRKFIAGAWAWIFPRHVVEQMLRHNLAQNWKGWYNKTIAEPERKKGIDTWIGHILTEMGKNTYFYNPGLGTHMGETSTLQNGHLKGNRVSIAPVDDPVSYFAKHAPPWVRWNLPSGDQRIRNVRQSNVPTSAVIPIAGNCEDITRRCLQHLQKHAPFVNPIVVNNASPAAPVLKREFPQVKWIDNQANVGFTPAVNQGMWEARGHHVLILNNDAFVQKDAVSRMRQMLDRVYKCGIIGPLTYDNGQQSLKHASRRKTARVGNLDKYDHAQCAAACQREFVTEEKMIVFFCALLNRDLINDIGMLDERLKDGLAADDLYCIRAKQRGWRLMVQYNAFVAHLHSETFRRLGLDRPKLVTEAHNRMKRIL